MHTEHNTILTFVYLQILDTNIYLIKETLLNVVWGDAPITSNKHQDVTFVNLETERILRAGTKTVVLVDNGEGLLEGVKFPTVGDGSETFCLRQLLSQLGSDGIPELVRQWEVKTELGDQ